MTTLLLIEDDPASRELALYLLKAAGYATLSASDGGTGLRLAVEQSPDLVLCDLHLPVLDGIEVVTELHASPRWRKTKVIALTASSMVGDRERILAAGFDAYLSKPITPETFVREVEAFLPPELRIGATPSKGGSSGGQGPRHR